MGQCEDLVLNSLLIASAVGFVIGLVIGKWGEAVGWRNSAGDYRRRESGGKLYVVREDWESAK